MTHHRLVIVALTAATFAAATPALAADNGGATRPVRVLLRPGVIDLHSAAGAATLHTAFSHSASATLRRRPELDTWSGDPRLGVGARTDISVHVSDVGPEVGKVTLYVPAGYALDPTAPPGTREGHVFLLTGSDIGVGDLTAVDHGCVRRHAGGASLRTWDARRRLGDASGLPHLLGEDGGPGLRRPDDGRRDGARRLQAPDLSASRDHPVSRRLADRFEAA